MAPDENAAPEVATEVNEEEAAEAAAAVEEAAAAVGDAEPETGDAPSEEASADEGDEGEGEASEEASEEEAEEAEEVERQPQTQPDHVPSMTDEVQTRMNKGIAQGEETRRATISRNQARKREQHAAIHATNRPGPSEPADDEE